MTRLVGEIHMGHAERGRMIGDLKHSVAQMRAGFRSAHTEMARKQHRMLSNFVSGLRFTVAGLRKTFGEDIAGAHRAFFGGMTAPMFGRAKRGK
jgi:hypothetical protein